MPKTRAASILLASLLLFVALVATPLPAAPPSSGNRVSDVATYQAIIGRLRAGQPYHAAVGDELRRGHYATREAFNWRTPLLWSALARVPDRVGQGSLLLLGVLLVGASIALTARESLFVVAGNLMQVGSLAMLAAPAAAVMGETWAGLLIGLSVCMHAFQRTRWAVALGLLALFVRELSAPYCAACAVMAAWNRRWRDVGAWLAGGCLYCLYYGWHLVHVWAHRLPTDLAHPTSWLELGGPASLLTKAQWQAWLVVSPPWATALALTMVAAAVVAPKAPAHVRMTSAVYLGFFLVAGKPFDVYWGAVAWPTWALAFGYGIDRLRDAALSIPASPRHRRTAETQPVNVLGSRQMFLEPMLARPDAPHRLVNVDRGTVIATDVEPAFESAARRKGLLGRERLPEGRALIIAPCNAIHMFFMRFAVDILFAARDGRVVKTRAGVRPWRIAFAMRAFAVIEAPEGTIARTGTRAGDRLAVDPSTSAAIRSRDAC